MSKMLHSMNRDGDHIASFAERMDRLGKKQRELIQPVREHPD
jgi:hypothetical protein